MSRTTIVVGLSMSAVGLSLLLTVSVRSSSDSTLKYVANRPVINQQVSGRLEAELLVLDADGFHPREITRPAGSFLLAVQNHSTADEISLVFKQEEGVAVREVRTSGTQSKLRELVDLPPGRYVVSETNHPDWNCTIIITSN